MFERYLAEQLATRFSHIISNFDANKVKISVWNGEVVLHDLTLKEDALQKIAKDEKLPVKISYGHIGTFELHIPWNILRSPKLGRKQAPVGSCSVVLSDVNVIISPGRARNTDDSGANNPHEERVKKEKLVQNILDEALFRKNIQQMTASEHDSSDGGKKSYVKNIVKTIISSLTVTVKNVHIRYEDPGDCLGFDIHSDSRRKVKHRPPFSIGIALEEFRLGSIKYGPEQDKDLFSIPSLENEEYSEKEKMSNKYTGRSNDIYSVEHKLAAAKNLSVYWDSDLSSGDMIHVGVERILRRKRRSQSNKAGNDDEFGDSFIDQTFSEGSCEDMKRSDSEPSGHEFRCYLFSSMLRDALFSEDYQRTFIIEPISPSLHCSIVSTINPESSNYLPPSRAVLKLTSLRMNINKTVLEDLAYLRKSFNLWQEMKTSLITKNLYEKITSSRPSDSPLKDPRAWWIYSFHAVKSLSSIKEENEERDGDKKRGWIGVLQAIRQKKEYISLYTSVFNKSLPADERMKLNERLCLFEESLQPLEITAFRVDAVSLIVAQSNRDSDIVNEIGTVKSKGWWKWNNEQSATDIQQSLFQDDDMMTISYRESIHDELCAALLLQGELGYESLITDSLETIEDTGLLLLKENVRSGSSFEVSVICPKMIFHVDDVVPFKTSSPSKFGTPSLRRHKLCRQKRPIFHIQTAFVQKLCLYQNSDWTMSSTFASLEIIDLMDGDYNISNCPKLLTRKRKWITSFLVTENADTEQKVIIGDQSHEHGGSIYLKKYEEEMGQKENASVTSISMKLSPMEIVYSPETIQAAAKVFSTTKTDEFSHDYQRLKHMVSNWKSQQKDRLIQALTQRERKLLTNIDISAPVFLMHDKTTDGTLVVDLGRLSFRDCNDRGINKKKFDNYWKLKLQDIQVFCMPRPANVSPPKYRLHHPNEKCNLVEPFSLEFLINTKFEEDKLDGIISDIVVDATLPRLVFNFRSSAVRLVHRLSQYRRIRKLNISSNENLRSLNDEISPSGTFSSAKIAQRTKKRSFINFSFSAPFVALKLVNDVDGRDCKPSNISSVTDIAELTLHGIGGKMSKEISTDRKSETKFSARVKSLHTVDSFQKAGPLFSHLISSYRPDLVDINLEKSDLVRLEYFQNDNGVEGGFGKCDKSISVKFHELFVEWNPETLASIHKALKLSNAEKDFFAGLEQEGISTHHQSPPRKYENRPSQQKNLNQTFSDDSVAFFDAFEEELDEEDVFLSDYSSEDEKKYHSPIHLNSRQTLNQTILSPVVMKAMRVMNERNVNFRDELIHLIHSESADFENKSPDDIQELPTVFISFELSKLRVRFNKETRLRRLLVAEMSQTSVRFQSKPQGGAKTMATFGNFTLSDPSKSDGLTIYGEILGLKTDVDASESMLQIIHETFPRDESLLYNTNIRNNPTHEKSLCIDKKMRSIEWFDKKLTMHFSPMRFVIIQQLWLEIIDYFFEGIVGFEVWGKTKPEVLSAVDKHQEKIRNKILKSAGEILDEEDVPGADASGVKFLRFDITMDSPVIILPVTYTSPQHLRFDLDTIRIVNHFEGDLESLTDHARFVQWYNCCDIDFDGLRLSSWSGTQLNVNNDPKISLSDSKQKDENRIPMKISLRWPTGPTAFLIIPKWNINVSIDSIRFVLQRNDFALFQHIVSYNIGEESRQMAEWRALQNLPANELKAYKEKIMVHFGYDKKDGPPTTFNIKVNISSIIFHFSIDEHNHVADVTGSNMNWSLLKKKDRISRQVLTFDIITLSQTSSNEEWSGVRDLFFPLKRNDNRSVSRSPQLTYKSTSKLSGECFKFLQVDNACIFMTYPAWMYVKSFFQNLPEPDIMNRKEVLSAVQIADRWYRIRNSRDLNTEKDIDTHINDRKNNMSTSPKRDYQFRLILNSPRIVLVDDSSLRSNALKTGQAVTLALNHLDYLSHTKSKYLSHEIFEKTVFLHQLEVYFGNAQDAISVLKQERRNSLLYPLCLGAGSTSHLENGTVMKSKSWMVSDVISVRTAYTDMLLAIDVFTKFLNDYNRTKSQTSQGNGISTSLSESQHVDAKSIAVACGGFDLLVIDDSGRHFAGAQELVQISLSGILYKKKSTPSSSNTFLEEMRLQLFNLELLDCLQPTNSPFRVVAAGNHYHNDTDNSECDMKQIQRWTKMNMKVFPDFMDWEDYKMQCGEWGFLVSDKMKERIIIASKSVMRAPYDGSNLINVTHTKSPEKHYDYNFFMGSTVLQWNPSMAIALQRFLGRLKKRVLERKSKSQSSLGNNVRKQSKMQSSMGTTRTAEVQLESFTVCLNKEHQQRRILQTIMYETNIFLEQDKFSKMNLRGSVGDFKAWDPDVSRDGKTDTCDKNRLMIGILRQSSVRHQTINMSQSEVRNRKEQLLTFKYYSNPHGKDYKNDDLPPWILEEVGVNPKCQAIDDCLSIQIASMQLNHIKERTGEIIDYLSNGLPGRGMGATSRAAKGFIKKRIKTRSFANVFVNSPKLWLPRHPADEVGIVVSLGDVCLRSWFEKTNLDTIQKICSSNLDNLNSHTCIEPSSSMTNKSKLDEECNDKSWWRALSISILGLGWSISKDKDQSLSSDVENPVNFHLQIRKPATQDDAPTIVRCKLTYMELVLSYSEYMLLKQVLKENVTKKIDKSLWDNPDDSLQEQEEGVRYSKNARFVRYGASSRNEAEVEEDSVKKYGTSLDLNFCLDGVKLILHRDDEVPVPCEDIDYNIALFEVADIAVQMVANHDRSKTGTVTIKSFSLIDIGDVGRMKREEMKRSLQLGEVHPQNTRRPSAFCVIARGYKSLDNKENNTAENPQLSISMDSNAASRTEELMNLGYSSESIQMRSVRVTLNHMNINPLFRPLNEVVEFLNGSWPCQSAMPKNISMNPKKEQDEDLSEKISDEKTKMEAKKNPTENVKLLTGIHVTVVTNYPRVFLLPDETDPSSRALVLRGLTILNATIINDSSVDGINYSNTLSLQGQLHRLESYINPDPRNVLEGTHGVDKSDNKNSTEELGVALIEPVTASFTVLQNKRNNHPTVRNVTLSIEPVSTTLSFQDIKLIEVVFSRWKSERDLVRSKISLGNTSSMESWLNPSDESELKLPSSNEVGSTISDTSIPLDADNLDIDFLVPSPSKIERPTSTHCDCFPASTENIFCFSPGSIQKAPVGVPTVLDDNLYQIYFTEQRLGLALEKREMSVFVKKVNDTNLHNIVHDDDEIVSVDTTQIAGLPFQSVLNIVANSSRPLKVVFKTKSKDPDVNDQNSIHESSSILKEKQSFEVPSISSNQTSQSESHSVPFTKPINAQTIERINFLSGVSNGLEFQKSACGSMAIVSNVDKDQYDESTRKYPKMYTPKSSSILLAINDVQTHSTGYTAIVEKIESLCSDSKDDSLPESYSLTFLDPSSKDLGAIDKIDIVISGIKLTLIDDINGRDMPLLRTSLRATRLKVERGLGLECNSIKVSPPSLFKIYQEYDTQFVCGDLSEVINRICAGSEVSIDYYNARIAVWEPLLEPSFLSIEIESQKGNDRKNLSRAGALSVALTDYKPPSESNEQQQPLLCFNLTDAAADILLTASQEWKMSRKIMKKNRSSHTLRESSSVFGGCNDLHENPLEVGAAQNAAQAALIFARRRDLDSQKSGQAKPFVLRNRSGLVIKFAAEISQQRVKEQDDEFGRKYDLCHMKRAPVTSVSDGEEARFNLATIEGSTYKTLQSQSSNGHGNKVRSYDGQFPLLSVEFETPKDVRVEILEHMSVVRIGETMRSLLIQKEKKTGETSFASVLVVWSVTLEKNRRVITISSAVRISSQRCGIPIQVGIRQKSDNGENSGSNIRYVGTADNSNFCFLPLWIELSFTAAEVLVRPEIEGKEFQWSNKSILQLERIQNDGSSFSDYGASVWEWIVSDFDTNVVCENPSETAYLSYEKIQESDKYFMENEDNIQKNIGMKSVDICTSLTLRNALPTDIQYELFTIDSRNNCANVIASSTNGCDRTVEKYMRSGLVQDFFACDLESMMLALRFRTETCNDFTGVVPINYHTENGHAKKLPLTNTSDPKTTREGIDLTTRRTVNVQSFPRLGTPTTIGVKILPRLKSLKRNGKSVNKVIGFEIVLHSELWIKNLTNIPIAFGARSRELFDKGIRDGSLDSIHEASRQQAAQAALLELSMLFDLDAKGSNSVGKSWSEEIFPLARQQCLFAIEELFEYVELKSGRVSRQWFAGLHPDNLKASISSYDHIQDLGWQWKDDSWSLDTSGGCKASQGGWESSNNLYGFQSSRQFNPNHSYRRRRWYRRKVRLPDETLNSNNFVFFHPLRRGVEPSQSKSSNIKDDKDENTSDDNFKMFMKVGDGAWSSPAMIPALGASHGFLRIPASRWPTLSRDIEERIKDEAAITGNALSAGLKGISKVKFSRGSLSPGCYDISYSVRSIEGHYGEHSRILVLYPRFFVRNESKSLTFQIKQVGAPDSYALEMKPNFSKPYYWADTSLPELICVRPTNDTDTSIEYVWSGGFDLSVLGLIPLRINKKKSSSKLQMTSPYLVVRSSIEIRSGTGGTGIVLSLKEEKENGEDSLYRIENQCPFPLWFLQEGCKDQKKSDGNIVMPGKKTSYGLDEPYRAIGRGGKVVSQQQLLLLRIGLAPLTSVDGIETAKIISLFRVGANLRLKPAKLRSYFDEDIIVDLMNINIQCVVSSDGPTRVLTVYLMERDITASSVIKNSVRMHTGGPHEIVKSKNKQLAKVLQDAAKTTIFLLQSKRLPKYDSKVNYSQKITTERRQKETRVSGNDCQYSFRLSLNGFLFSLIDKVPSEVAVITLRKVNVMAEWNTQRSKGTTFALSLDWLQIDNHCPNTPFPVAFVPCLSRNDDKIDEQSKHPDTPFLSIGVICAPRHKSAITCLEGLTVSFQNISFGTDLAFVLRVQQYILGILSHLEKSESQDFLQLPDKGSWEFPEFNTFKQLRSTHKKSISKQIYFECITVMPFTIKLSIAPSVALTSAQAKLEGFEAGAIHAAVRKGDLLIGSKKLENGVVGVKIGSKNRTAMAVIRGIFKSILVDSLLRCDDVSLNFAIFVDRNHLSTVNQLKTFIGQHYLSLLKSNMPALLGSLSAFGNPVGLIRGFGDGVSDFVSEPVKGFKRSVQELDVTYAVDGIARGTGSLARHTVGGIVDSASLLTETFSKNMAVLTLDRKYAQRRDRFKTMPGTNITFVDGIESGMGKLIRGVAEGVVGVVRAPMRGAEKRGVEGFAKGVGKGLLGLVVKPVIGISDAATDVMAGVKGSLDGVGNKTTSSSGTSLIRPRRAFYGQDRRLKPYTFVDAISAAIMLKTKLGGENYLSHCDMGGRVVILSVRRLLLIGDDGDPQLLLKLKNIKRIDLRQVPNGESGVEWGVLIFFKSARGNGNEVEVITSSDRDIAKDLCMNIQHGISQLER